MKSQKKIGKSLKKCECVDLDCIEQVINVREHKQQKLSLKHASVLEEACNKVSSWTLPLSLIICKLESKTVNTNIKR